MGRLGSLVLFLKLVELLWIPLYLIWCWLIACCILLLLCLCMYSLFPISLRLLSWKKYQILSKHFSSSVENDHEVFFSQFVYMAEYLDRFSYVEPTMNLWIKAYLIMVDYILMCSSIQFLRIYWAYAASMGMRDTGL